MLVASYEGLKKAEATIPEAANFRVTEAVQRLIELYDETDNQEQAVKWRAELEKRKLKTRSDRD